MRWLSAVSMWGPKSTSVLRMTVTSSSVWPWRRSTRSRRWAMSAWAAATSPATSTTGCMGTTRQRSE